MIKKYFMEQELNDKNILSGGTQFLYFAILVKLLDLISLKALTKSVLNGEKIIEKYKYRSKSGLRNP